MSAFVSAGSDLASTASVAQARPALLGTSDAKAFLGTGGCASLMVGLHTGWGPRSIAFSWFISGLTMVYCRYDITIVNGDYNGL